MKEKRYKSGTNLAVNGFCLMIVVLMLHALINAPY
jgi:hypothetical protein